MKEEPELERIKQLRTALAINRGMELLEQIPGEIAKTVEHDESQRRSYLEGLYVRINRDLFKNWKQDDIAQRPGDIADSQDRETLRKALLETLCYPNGEHGPVGPNTPKPLFDSNGFVVRRKPEELAEVLGNFYGKMREIKPFAYGNELTLNFFMTALGRVPAFAAVYPEGIDFRRLEDKDISVLHDTKALDGPGRREELKTAFLHALDVNRTPHLDNPKDGHRKWPKHVEFISGIPFLSQDAKDGTKCLVTVNGGMVPLDKIRGELEAEIVSNKPIADFKPIGDGQLLKGEYVPGTEELRKPGKKDVDGIPVTDKGAPLLCLDFNILTGLRPASHDALEALVKEVNGKDAKIFDLANNEPLRDKLLARAGEDGRLRRAIEIGYDHLSIVTKKLDKEKDKIFEGKTRVSDPHFVESFGGAGAGKSQAEDMMKARYGDNWVKASLDSFREHSDLYKVLTGADHHADDYRIIEPFANTLREWVANAAREEHKNILYDGTGIPHKPRYSDLAKSFKKEGFHTEIVGFDIPLPEAIKRVNERFEEKHRALPWIVVVGKHVRAPRAFMSAVEDPYVDKISLFAKEGPVGQDYLIAETFNGNADAARKHSGSMVESLRNRAVSHAESILRQVAGQDKVNELLERIPGFKDGDAFNISYPMGSDKSRELAIYDTKRFNQFLEKGALNPYASDEEGLYKRPEAVSFLTRSLQEQQRQRAARGVG